MHNITNNRERGQNKIFRERERREREREKREKIEREKLALLALIFKPFKYPIQLRWKERLQS